MSRQYALIGTIISKIPYLVVKQEISGLAKEIHQIKETVDTLTITFDPKPGIKQEISYAEIKEDLQRLKGKHINKLSEIPKRLARRIKGYLLLTYIPQMYTDVEFICLIVQNYQSNTGLIFNLLSC